MASPRDLPSVSELLSQNWARNLCQKSGQVLITSVVRKAIDAQRMQLLENPESWSSPDWKECVESYLQKLRASETRRAVNATGILLHTGLGRAVLPSKAVDCLHENLQGATQLEIDPLTGKRSQRDAYIGSLLCELFGGEEALVVNNNAAATLLVLHALAANKEVVISRGELVEIGGSFRLPEIMIQSQVELKEVGATNKTRLSDFEKVLNSNTGLIMKAHTSNYRVIGFTQEVPIEDLVKLGNKFRIPVVHDIGSGALVDFKNYGFDEPLASQSLKQGADLVFFSGDKLLGSAQAGIIIGKKEFVQKCRKNPLARALRVDKMTLLVLEETLHLYRENNLREIPLFSRLNLSQEDLKKEAESLASQISSPWKIVVESAPGEMGSGSVPGKGISSFRIVLEHKEMSSENIALKLRQATVPIYGSISQDKFGLNILSIFPEEHEMIIEELKQL